MLCYKRGDLVPVSKNRQIVQLHPLLPGIIIDETDQMITLRLSLSYQSSREDDPGFSSSYDHHPFPIGHLLSMEGAPSPLNVGPDPAPVTNTNKTCKGEEACCQNDADGYGPHFSP